LADSKEEEEEAQESFPKVVNPANLYSVPSVVDLPVRHHSAVLVAFLPTLRILLLHFVSLSSLSIPLLLSQDYYTSFAP